MAWIAVFGEKAHQMIVAKFKHTVPASSASQSCCRADGKLVDIDGLSSQQLRRQNCRNHFHHRPASWLPFDRDSGFRATLGGGGGNGPNGFNSGPHSILVTTTRNGPGFLRGGGGLGAGGRKPRPKSMDATVLQSLESKIVIHSAAAAAAAASASKQAGRHAGGGGTGSCDTEEESSPEEEDEDDDDGSSTDTNKNEVVTVQHRTTHVHVNPTYLSSQQQQQRNISQV